MIGYRGVVNVGPITTEGDGSKKLKAGIYHYETPPKDINDIFPNAKNVGSKNQRKRWIDEKNRNIYEWDYQHGDIEIYNKRGIHQGSINHKTKKRKTSCERKKN